MLRAMTDFAFIARGKLFVSLGEEVREIESPFAQDVSARASRIARKNAWKSGGTGARFMRGFGGTPDDALDQRAPLDPIQFVALSRGRHEGELLYAIASGPVSGVFAFSSGEESRLFHGTDVRVNALACAKDGSRIACSAEGAQGRSHIAVMSGAGSELTFVTEGDCMDSDPVFEGGSSDTLLYCSRGFGYDAHGRPSAFGRGVVERLSLGTAEVTRVAEDEDADCGEPRVGPGGALFYVERPTPKPYRPSVWRTVLDVVLFPFRLVGAILSYLNFFVMRWSGKRLINSGSASARRADARRLWETSNVTNAIEDIEEDPAIEKEIGRVPESHALVRLHGGEREVVAKRVACFDVADDGAVVYSDGRDIFVRTNGQTKKVIEERFVSHVVAVPPQEL